MNDRIRLVPTAYWALLGGNTEVEGLPASDQKRLLLLPLVMDSRPENTDPPSQSHCEFGADLSPCNVTCIVPAHHPQPWKYLEVRA